MGKSRRSNTKRREARLTQSAPSYPSSTYPSTNARRAFRNPLLGSTPRNQTQTRWEPSTALSSYFKQVAKTPVAYSQPQKAPSTQKSQKYSQPKWADVTQKKIEQPTAVSKSLCEQRSERKQIMFATGNAGKRGQKTPLWTELSRRKCK